MKLSGLIIMSSFLFSLLGCKGPKSNTRTTDIFPDEKFSIIDGTLNGKHIIGSFNMTYKDYDKRENYPWCLTISIALNIDNLFENGLPKSEESAIANKLEDDLLFDIRKITPAHYIGHLYNDTFLDIYIYLNDPKKTHDYLKTQINKPGLIRPFRYEINNDPKWTTVSRFFK